jgi:hypothetical protein
LAPVQAHHIRADFLEGDHLLEVAGALVQRRSLAEQYHRLEKIRFRGLQLHQLGEIHYVDARYIGAPLYDVGEPPG